MKFKDFINLDEVGTSTSSIAGFKRISIPNIRRRFPSEVIGPNETEEECDKKKDKKKPYRVPQLEEASRMGSFIDGMGQALTGQNSYTPSGQQGDVSQDESAKTMAKQLEQMAQRVEQTGNQQQLVTLLKTMSSTYNRLSDQWTQANNIMKTANIQQPQQQQNPYGQQNGQNPWGILFNKAVSGMSNAVQSPGTLGSPTA